MYPNIVHYSVVFLSWFLKLNLLYCLSLESSFHCSFIYFTGKTRWPWSEWQCQIIRLLWLVSKNYYLTNQIHTMIEFFHFRFSWWSQFSLHQARLRTILAFSRIVIWLKVLLSVSQISNPCDMSKPFKGGSSWTK